MAEADHNPYAPPTAELAPTSGSPARELQGFRSPAQLGRAAAIAVGVSVGVSGLQALVAFLELADIETTGMISIVELSFVAISGVVFLMWVHRIHANLPALGKQGPVTPGSAVGFYFVPFANLVRPYQDMLAAWRLSAPKRSLRDAPNHIGLWWAAYLLRAVVPTLYSLIMLDAPLERLEATIVLSGFGDLVAGILCIDLINKLTARQCAAGRRRGRRKRRKAKRAAAALEKMFGDVQET